MSIDPHHLQQAADGSAPVRDTNFWVTLLGASGTIIVAIFGSAVWFFGRVAQLIKSVDRHAMLLDGDQKSTPGLVIQMTEMNRAAAETRGKLDQAARDHEALRERMDDVENASEKLATSAHETALAYVRLDSTLSNLAKNVQEMDTRTSAALDRIESAVLSARPTRRKRIDD